MSDTSLYLNHQFSVGMWIYVMTAGDILEKLARFKLASNGIGTIVFESPLEVESTVTNTGLTFTGWRYLSFTISYSSGSTTMTAYSNNSPGTALTTLKSIFRDLSSNLLYVGKSTGSSSFVGYIYHFTL